MQIRDRVKQLCRVPVEELIANPKNWRNHPPQQAAAMQGILEEVGWADALLARETPEGLQLLDGHLRKDIAPGQVVPVLVLDLNEEEAEKILLTHDPICALAETATDKFNTLRAQLDFESESLRDMLDQWSRQADQAEEEHAAAKEVAVEQSYQVVVDCPSEEDQATVYEQLTAQGFHCRLLML